MTTSREHPSNAPGAFYVKNGCCLSCGVPKHIAPNLFGSDQDDQCYVKRQPRTDSEVTTMLRVLVTQDLRCIRYRGADEAVLQRIAEFDEIEVCDEPLLRHIKPQHRDRATFSLSVDLAAPELLVRLIEFLGTNSYEKKKTTKISPIKGGARISVWWFKNCYHRVEVHAPRSATGRWQLLHRGPIGLSMTLSDWLASDPAIVDQDWRTREEVENRAPGKPTPW